MVKEADPIIEAEDSGKIEVIKAKIMVTRLRIMEGNGKMVPPPNPLPWLLVTPVRELDIIPSSVHPMPLMSEESIEDVEDPFPQEDQCSRVSSTLRKWPRLLNISSRINKDGIPPR